MNFVRSRLHWIFAILCIGFVASLPFRHVKPTMPGDIEAFGRIPVSAEGRVKPLDTFARNTLLSISGRQTFMREDKKAPAIEWYLELLSNPTAADAREVFRIDHPELVAMLGFQDSKRVRFSFDEIKPHFQKIYEQADLASAVPAKKRDPFQRQVLDLTNRLMAYSEVSRGRSPFLVAPTRAGEEWHPLSDVPKNSELGNYASARAIYTIFSAAANNQTEQFDQTVAEYEKLTNEALSAESTRSAIEVIFSRAEPFYQTSILYVLAFVLACLGFLTSSNSASEWPRAFSRASLAVILVAFVVHTLGIAARIYLQGRPPVTNLYSSAVFIGWACIPLALAAEWFVRLGLGNLVSSLIGFATLVVAHNLSSGGDTMQMMQAVLDSNFWLATHVVVITIGYSATFLAGFIAAGYLIFGAFTRKLTPEALKSLPKMTYGVICFASLTSFVGTVLGGIWADQSWGRFWGWDPKENGAALIVFMTLIILHARWGGMIKDRGVAVLAVAGNIVTAWSWFGTNMLGVGLHAYGFMDSAVFYLIAFALSQLAIMCIGFIPVAKWRSVTGAAAPQQPAPRSGKAKPAVTA